jgi:prepilin-type N-terminal cleavage/methylation domain-containing protein
MLRVSNRRGFTLIELIISVAIITLLSAVLFINFSNQNRRASVRQAATQIALDLQKMYSKAQAGLEQGGATQLGYGLSLQTTQGSYSQFFDTTAAADSVYTDATELLQFRNLPANIVISSIQLKPRVGPTVNVSRADVLYKVPGATLSAKAGNPTPLSTTTSRIIITVQHATLTSLSQCVAITPAIGAVNLTCS